MIGGGIFVAGLVLQAGLTSGLHIASFISYVAQAIVSVEASYLLNRWVTWKGARSPFWGSFFRYNLQKIITVTANLILYAGLLKLGMNYLLANILLTIVFTFVNYIGADRFVFLGGSKQLVAAVTGPLPIITGPMPVLRVDRQTRPRRRPTRRALPAISVVIPVRSNERTIRAAVDSILRQDYPVLRELVLVGSPGDSTWSALGDIADPRLFIMETATPPGIRDANFKRDLGIRETTGALVALIDSDMVIPPDWMSNAVRLLMENEVDCVAGVMRSIRDDFWGRFVDSNRLSAKTPRAKSSYLVTADGFGAAGYKPPITADILFTRTMYEDCPIDSSWSHGSLEDYEWFWRVVEGGHQVLVSNRLFGWHHHRAGFKKLAAEYRRSARGCAYFIRAHRDSPFAQKRMTQAIVLPIGLLAVLLGLATGVMMGRGILAADAVLAFAVVGVVLLCAREFARTRTLESFIYPVPAVLLGVNYTASLVIHLIRSAPVRIVTSAYGGPDTAGAYPARRSGLARILHPLTFIIALQAGLSLSLVWSNTAFGDEADYLWVGGTLVGHALHGTAWPTSYAHRTLSGLPFIYPPLGGLANMAGGLGGARLLSLFFMVCATCFIYFIARSLYGRTCATCAVALWSVFSPTIELGAFATFDALSVSLTSCAAWIALQAGYRRRRGEIVAASAAILAIAEAAAYTGIVMIPVVIAFIFLAWIPRMGLKQASFCAAWLTGVCVIVFSGIMTICKCWPGIINTVLSRQVTANGYASVAHVFNDSWTYSGTIAIIALVGAIFAFSSGTKLEAIQVGYLTAIALVIPVAQAHDSTAVSLKKHLAYGAIFATIAAGYGLARLGEALPAKRWAAIACCAVALIFPGVNGIQQAESWFHSWPDESSLLAQMSPRLIRAPVISVDLASAAYLCDYYYADRGNTWEKCHNSLTISSARAGTSQYIILGYPASLAPPKGLPSTLLLSPDATQQQFLSYLAQNASGATANQSGELPQLTEILEQSGQYHLVATGPYNSNQSTGIYTVWQKVAKNQPVKPHAVSQAKGVGR